jgi:aspartokinase
MTVAGRALSAPPGHARRAAQALAVAGIAVRGRLVDAGRAAFLVDADAASAAVRTLHAALLGDSAP